LVLRPPDELRSSAVQKAPLPRGLPKLIVALTKKTFSGDKSVKKRSMLQETNKSLPTLCGEKRKVVSVLAIMRISRKYKGRFGEEAALNRC
jgi:hypothetical protein